MSTTENLDLLNTTDWLGRYAQLAKCASTAPEGAFQEAKITLAFVNDAVSAIMGGLLQGGLSASIGQPYTELQAAIYAYIRRSNPNRVVFSTMEYWGENIDGADGAAMKERVKAALSAFAPENLDVQIIEGQV